MIDGVAGIAEDAAAANDGTDQAVASDLFADIAICWSAAEHSSFVPDKTCSSASDCRLIEAPSCYSSSVFAVANSASCDTGPLPPCFPENNPPRYVWNAEDGSYADSRALIGARCLSGKCQSYVLP